MQLCAQIRQRQLWTSCAVAGRKIPVRALWLHLLRKSLQRYARWYVFPLPLCSSNFLSHDRKLHVAHQAIYLVVDRLQTALHILNLQHLTVVRMQKPKQMSDLMQIRPAPKLRPDLMPKLKHESTRTQKPAPKLRPDLMTKLKHEPTRTLKPAPKQRPDLMPKLKHEPTRMLKPAPKQRPDPMPKHQNVPSLF